MRKQLCSLVLGIASVIVTLNSASAAEKIKLNYGLLSFSLSVESLAKLAQEGRIEPELAFYLKFLSDKQQNDLQKLLRSPYEVDPIIVSRMGHTSVGKKLLKDIGNLIQTPSGQNGFYALRAAVVLAAADPEGCTPITFLQKLPTDIEINIADVFKLVKEVSRIKKQTDIFVSKLKQENKEITDKKATLDLRQPGNLGFSQQSLHLLDTQRNRQINVDLYLPQITKKAIPVIVISNGLGARRDRFKQLAQHLASYGFAVVIPDHPGSDRNRQQAFYQGFYQENFDSGEFINRPLDITLILDELEKRQKEFPVKLNLQQVGIFGYSFGGATALSLAGAEINYPQLQKDCASSKNLFNISLLYQCRALEIKPPKQKLQDSRIKAAFLFVPFSNSLFGKSGINKVKLPVIWQTTTQDLITPLLLEQIPAFSSLNSPHKYLVVAEGIPHAYLTKSKKQAESDNKIRQIAQISQNALAIAFFKVYLAQEKDYQAYLQPDYVQSLSKTPYNLSLVENLSVKQEKN
jgi:predicted dienelactone hydrolase